MDIVLTGASGFVGSSLLRRLGGAHRLFCLGRSLPENAPDGARLVACNLADPADVMRAVSALPPTVDAVINYAVSRLHRTFPETALDMFHVNVAAAAVLLDYARRAGAELFIQGSTGSVYDSITTSPLREDMVLSPKNYFPISKFAGEQLSIPYQKHFRTVVLRFFTPYGPHQANRLVPDLLARVRSGNPVTLPASGDGLALMATWGDDIVAITHDILANETWRGVYNIANPEVLTIKSMAETIGAKLGAEPRFERSASASSYSLLPDLGRLGERLSGKPMLPFATGIAEIIRAEGLEKA